MQIADTSVFDNIKEKITNPIMFTYFWVFCTYNHKPLLILFFEPDRFINKMKFLSYWGTFFWPLVAAFIALLALPWLNNYVEIWKQKAHQYMQKLMHDLEWVPMVEQALYQKAKNEINELKLNLNSLRDNEDKLNLKVNEQKDQINKLFNELQTAKQADSNHDENFNKLTNQAILIIEASAKVSGGGIIMVDNEGSDYRVSVDGTVLNPQLSDDRGAKWSHAIEQLRGYKYIDESRPNVYRISSKGYDFLEETTK